MNTRLLRRFLELYPFQPATALWRAVEIDHLAAMHMPHGRALDLGCGDGRLTSVLMEVIGPRDLTGLDIDPLETALAANQNIYREVFTTSAERIPVPDASFDVVISISVMEHIPRLDLVLREVARVLRDGGRLITTVPGVGFHRALRGPFMPFVSRSTYLEAIDRRLAHLRYWTVSEWKAALDVVEMELAEVRTFLSGSEVRRWEAVSRLTAGALYLMSGGRPPIEIQRSLGMRRAGQRLPGFLATILSHVLSAGVRSIPSADEYASGCLLLTATRNDRARNA